MKKYLNSHVSCIIIHQHCFLMLTWSTPFSEVTQPVRNLALQGDKVLPQNEVFGSMLQSGVFKILPQDGVLLLSSVLSVLPKLEPQYTLMSSCTYYWIPFYITKIYMWCQHIMVSSLSLLVFNKSSWGPWNELCIVQKQNCNFKSQYKSPSNCAQLLLVTSPARDAPHLRPNVTISLDAHNTIYTPFTPFYAYCTWTYSFPISHQMNPCSRIDMEGVQKPQLFATGLLGLIFWLKWCLVDGY